MKFFGGLFIPTILKKVWQDKKWDIFDEIKNVRVFDDNISTRLIINYAMQSITRNIKKNIRLLVASNTGFKLCPVFNITGS